MPIHSNIITASWLCNLSCWRMSEDTHTQSHKTLSLCMIEDVHWKGTARSEKENSGLRYSSESSVSVATGPRDQNSENADRYLSVSV